MPDLRSPWRPALYHGRGKRPHFREQVIFEGVGRHAGLEIVGPIHEIQKLAQVI